MTQIRHSDAEGSPRIGARYRCHVCRLELVLDPQTGKLTVTPLESESDADAERGANE